MAKPILVANWKNHPGSLPEAKRLLQQLSRYSRLFKKTSFFIAPPEPYFETVAYKTGNFVELAVQDMPSVSTGTYTGQVTPDILKSFGTRLAILGHSECRALGETSESVSGKIQTALRAGIAPLVCVGEVSRDQDGEHFEFLREEIKASLAGLDKKSDISKLVIAYEPIWAIGKTAKDAIQPSDLAQSIIFIKKILSDLFGRKLAEDIPILYGGSVEPSNVEELLRGTGVKGLLVGHASLVAKELKEIAESLVKA